MSAFIASVSFGVELVARRELRGDLPRRHRTIGVAQHIENGSAALAARNERRLFAPQYWPDRVWLGSRIEYSDRTVKAADILAELQDALLCGDQLARQFSTFRTESGNDVWIGHPHMVGWRPSRLNADVVALAT
jgi:hypothetical protein